MHSKPSGSHTHHHSDHRWIRVTERRTPDGGVVAVYSDITELKEHEQELRLAKDEAVQALTDLKQAQNNLVQAEKLALLGQLVAGIAHEIKNPLNFINNFSELSVELLDELKDALTEALPHLDEKVRGDVDDLIATLTVNFGKIRQHGERADSIVKSMLAHSREGAGERRLANINDLVEESLNLAYHGARAQDQGFNITLERAFDPNAGDVEVIPQDVTRVLLNLFSNGFYATQKRKRDSDDPSYQPTLKATTHRVDGTIEIRVRDNGAGIPKDVVDKIFTPFFTTKPTGEGTGLGLSLSYDIVVHQHNGTFDVDTREGEYTEFIVSLPCGAGDTTTSAQAGKIAT
jgi:two-component system, NtrC family, sensor kinase